MDSYEPNNFQIESFEFIQGEKTISSYLWCMYDEDWYKFNSGELFSIINLESPEALEYNLLVLLYKDGQLIKSLNENEYGEVNVSCFDYNELYVKVYSAFGYYNQREPYILDCQ